MTAHKEQAMNEKHYHVSFGATCVTGYGDLIESRDYSTSEEFMAALQIAWDKLWVEVYSAEPAGGSLR